MKGSSLLRVNCNPIVAITFSARVRDEEGEMMFLVHSAWDGEEGSDCTRSDQMKRCKMCSCVKPYVWSTLIMQANVRVSFYLLPLSLSLFLDIFKL